MKNYENNNCIICGNETECITHPKTLYTYDYCLSCELISLHDYFILNEEKEKQRYLSHNNTNENEGYVKMFEDFLDSTLGKEISNFETALDYGCGTHPVLSEILEKKGIKTDYYDPYFFPEKIFKDKQYDLICCTEVLEHVYDPLELFFNFKNHLKEDGKLALMTMFHSNNEDEFFKWWYVQDSTHIRFFTVKTIEYLCSKFELKLVFTDKKNRCLIKKIK